jgi:hypothetical protein
MKNVTPFTLIIVVGPAQRGGCLALARLSTPRGRRQGPSMGNNCKCGWRELTQTYGADDTKWESIGDAKRVGRQKAR